MSSPTTPTPASLVVHGLDFGWPDGTVLFRGLELTLGPGRTGLIGSNGSGKSTLLRLLAGRIEPGSGTVRTTGTLGYLPQDLVLDAGLPVAEALGIAGARTALRAIERGDATEENFTLVGDSWDVEEQARATLDRLGLTAVHLDGRIGELSGGETVLLGLAGQLLRRPDLLLLDEPSNNLDRRARQHLYDAVAAWKGALVLVSHDRELLARVDRIADLRDGQVRCFGGNLDDYEAALAVEQEAAERLVRAAEADVRRQERELTETRVRLGQRKRYGQKMYDSKREPRIAMNANRRKAQVSSGKLRVQQEGKVTEARERLAVAESSVHEDAAIRVDLPSTEVPAGRAVLALRAVRLRHSAPGSELDLSVHGPERIALLGANGSGKTTLLRTLAGELAPLSGEAELLVPVRHLPQRLDLLDDRISLAGNVARYAPGATDNEIRARLARFLFRGKHADRAVGTLSGGERLRATLAALMLADPAPQLLLLDEPTNNLDLAGVRQLTAALAAYRGAMIVASHDPAFLEAVGTTRSIRLGVVGQVG